MKIGPLDIGIKTLALSAALVVVAMLDLKLLVSNNAKRIEGFYSNRIPAYLYTGTQRDMEDGLTQCGYMLKVMGNHVTVRLYKATFLYNLNEFDKAQDAFRSIADDRTVPEEYRAMAAFSVGACVFSKTPEAKRTDAAIEAGDWFIKSLEISPDFPDAKVGLCIAAEWRLRAVSENPSTPEAQASLKQVQTWLLAALQEKVGKEAPTASAIAQLQLQLLDTIEKSSHPPGLQGMAQFYNIRGLAYTRAKKILEAEEAFDAAQSLRPRWDAPAKNQFRAMVRLLPETDLKLSQREGLLTKYTSKITRNQEDARVALIAFAVAWFKTREVARSDDYKKIGYIKALALLKQAYENRGDVNAVFSALAVMDERLFADPKDGGVLATISKDMLMPCPPVDKETRWEGNAPNKGTSHKGDVRKALAPVHEVASAMKALLVSCLKNVRLDAGLSTEVKLRLLSCDMLIALATLADDQQALRTVLPQRAQEILGEASDNPNAQMAYAHFMLRAGNFPEAARAIRRAAELGSQDENVKALMGRISEQPKLIQTRPDKSGWFGQRPLVRATLWSPESPGQILSGEMSVDEQAVSAKIVGGQIVYLLPEGRLTNGKHAVKIAAVDAYGNGATADFEFVVDKVAPKVGVTPAAGTDMVGPLPTWTIQLSDEGAGVDYASIQVRLNNVGTGSTPCRTILVDNGLYQVDIPGVQAKRGDRVTSDSFKVASVLNLTTGTYELRIVFSDQAGNAKEQSWTFQVK